MRKLGTIQGNRLLTKYKSNIPKFYISESQDPEGPPYIPYEEILPTKESNALIGGILTVDENRGDVPAKTEKTSEVMGKKHGLKKYNQFTLNTS